MVEIEYLQVINQAGTEAFAKLVNDVQESIARETGLPAHLLRGDDRPAYKGGEVK